MKNLKLNIQVFFFINLLFAGANFGTAQTSYSDTSIFSEFSIAIHVDQEEVKINVGTRVDSNVSENSTLETEAEHEADAHVGENFKKYLVEKNTAISQKNYRYTSDFDADLTLALETLLVKELGQPNQVGEKEKAWNHLDGKKISGLEISLKTGKCKIRYSGKNKTVINQITILTQKICKLTYRGNCD